MIRLGCGGGARMVELWLYEETKRDIGWQAHCVAARGTLLNGNHILALCSWISKPLDPENKEISDIHK